jgi:hypothetical protein
VPNGDRRRPHADLAGLFDGTRSRYAYQVEGLHEVLLEQFGMRTWKNRPKSNS